jgi:arylsulfatase A-like enzyme
VERGVRFVELFHRGWDHHGISFNTDIVNGMPLLCNQVDGPAAALLKDLKQRGLLDTTLVVFAGEFGRTPMLQGDATKSMGRDHHIKAFTVWMAGGGSKPGVSVGKTDDFGFNSVEQPVSTHDLHATALHLLGIDHTKLTYKFKGRNFRLTDVEGEVVQELLA